MEEIVKFFNFKGRINRGPYFMYSLLLGSINLGLSMLEFYDNLVLLYIMEVISIVLLIANLSLTAKRFHDLDRPGWHILLGIIPIYNVYLCFILLFKRGTDGENQYGSNPIVLNAA